MNFITSSSCGRRRCCRRHRHSRGRSLSLSRRRSSSSSSSRSGKSIGGSRSSGSRSSSSSSSISSGMDMYEVFATTRIFAAAQAQNNAILGSNNDSWPIIVIRRVPTTTRRSFASQTGCRMASPPRLQRPGESSTLSLSPEPSTSTQMDRGRYSHYPPPEAYMLSCRFEL